MLNSDDIAKTLDHFANGMKDLGQTIQFNLESFEAMPELQFAAAHATDLNCALRFGDPAYWGAVVMVNPIGNAERKARAFGRSYLMCEPSLI